MANFFDQFDAPQAPPSAPAPQPGKGNFFDQFDPNPKPAAMAAQPPQVSGGILPFSRDASGNLQFDSNAGILGALKSAFTLPGDVYAGKVDPTSPEGQQRTLDLALTMSPGSAALRAGERAIPGPLTSLRREKVTPPTADELKSAASAGYDAARNTGAEYLGKAVSNAAGDIQRNMESDGILAELAPQTFSILGKLQNPPKDSVVTIASLDAARKALNRVGGNFQNPTEQEAARRVIRGIDGIIEAGGNGAGRVSEGVGEGLPVSAAPGGAGATDGAGSGGSMAPDPAQAEAARLITEARGNAAAGFRSGRITGAEDAADLRAAAANSGQNRGNTLRQRLASLLLNDKQSRGFSPEELAAMRQVVEGTATGNTLRYVSNLLGGGGGIGQTGIAALGAAAGGATGGGAGAAIGATLVPLLGAATRKGYNALVGRQVGKLDELIRQRSPLSRQQAAAAPLLRNRYDLANGLALRGLLMGAPQQGSLLGGPPNQ